MALARIKNWTEEALLYTDLNAEFNNILNNPGSLICPITFNLTFTDATYDIGASGATRPRDLFLSRNAVIGGTLAVTGVTTLSNNLKFDTNTAASSNGVIQKTSAQGLLLLGVAGSVADLALMTPSGGAYIIQNPTGTSDIRLAVDGTASVNSVSPVSTTYFNFPAGTTGTSSIRLAHGSAPTSPVNGDMWTTTAGLYVRVNGATVGPLS